MGKKYCVVLDTNVLLSGLQSKKGASYQILRRLGQQFDVAVSAPHSVHLAVKEFSASDDISMNQFISSAITEKIASLNAESYLRERGQHSSRELFLQVLDKVPD